MLYMHLNNMIELACVLRDYRIRRAYINKYYNTDGNIKEELIPQLLKSASDKDKKQYKYNKESIDIVFNNIVKRKVDINTRKMRNVSTECVGLEAFKKKHKNIGLNIVMEYNERNWYKSTYQVYWERNGRTYGETKPLTGAGLGHICRDIDIVNELNRCKYSRMFLYDSEESRLKKLNTLKTSISAYYAKEAINFATPIYVRCDSRQDMFKPLTDNLNVECKKNRVDNKIYISIKSLDK